jgi:hypothetical protein
MPPRNSGSARYVVEIRDAAGGLPLAHQRRLDGQRARLAYISGSAAGRHEGRYPGQTPRKQASQR